MENFVVSARKYRPTLFNSVVGQNHITTTLKNAIKNNHLAQAFLFCGPRGVGKTTCARILAKTINCPNLTPENEACDICPSCISISKGNSMSFFELDAASNNSVDDIRALVEQVRMPPQNSKYKVYIIDEVHMLSNAAFNAFLKTLEEPPPYAKFILATTEKHKILPTILSRCQIFDFNRIQPADISSHLGFVAKQENITYEQESLNIIAQKADGGLRDALSMFDQLVSFCGDNLLYKDVAKSLNILDYDVYFETIENILVQDSAALMVKFAEVINNGFDGQQFIVGLAEHIRNLLICKDPRTLVLLEVSEEVKKKYQIQAFLADNSLLLTALNILNQADIHYKQAKNQRLHTEITLLKLSNIAFIVNASSISSSNTEDLKKK